MTTEMKDSGVKWIGAVPADWKINKIKYIAVLKGRIGWQGLTSDEYTDDGAYLITGVDFENGCINWDSCVHIPMRRWEEARDIRIEDGDLLITKDGTIGKVAIVSGCNAPTSLNSGVLRISTMDGYDRRFLYWVLQSDVFWTWFADKNAGNSTIQHLYQGDFAEFKYAVHPIYEQRTIAAFLDDECAKIDSIIDDLERQIIILESYRNAVITEAVTHGLKKASVLFDTKIESVGLLPSGWTVNKIKYVCTLVRGGSPRPIEDFLSEDENDVNWIKIGDTKKGYKYIDSTSQKIIRAGVSRSRYVKKGTLLLTNSMSFGQPYILNTDGCIHDGWLAFSEFKDISKEFLFYVLMSELCLKQFNKAAIGAVVDNLSIEKVGSTYIPIPSLEEQVDIVSYLDKECAKIDEIAVRKEKQLTQMKEHKYATIYEYVTGKKRVKEVTNYAN